MWVRVRFDQLDGFCSYAVNEWGKQHLTPQSTVVSDVLACFAAVTDRVLSNKSPWVVAPRAAALTCLALTEATPCCVT